MRRTRFTDEEIATIVAQSEVSGEVRGVCRRYGITPTTLYRWKAQFAGMDSAEVKRVRRLEEENRRLRQIVADQALNIETLKDVLKKDS